MLYFAASDYSDPRTNNKDYTIQISSSYTKIALLTLAPFYFFVAIAIASLFAYAGFRICKVKVPIDTIRENLLFSTLFIATLFFSMVFVYTFGFYEMVEVNSLFPRETEGFYFCYLGKTYYKGPWLFSVL